jgi:hypothetical protein
MLADHRDELVRRRVQTVNRLQRLLAELTPGKAKKDITALQAKAILASVRPRDVVGKTRRRLAAEQLADLVGIEKKIKVLTKELQQMVRAGGSTLTELPGVGPDRRCPGAGRRRRHRSVRGPQPVRLVDRNRADSSAYHGYRRSRDLTLINEQPPADVTTRPWMRAHDAAIRQCEAMAELLGEEVQALTQMVQSAGVMAQIHDAESADTLNKVASAAAVGIGLPSLGLAYYGADKLFALDLTGAVAVLAVILVPTLLAVPASMVVSRGRTRHTTVGMGVLIGCLLLCLILPTIVSKALHLAG